jgi:hypothetical protein
MLAQTEAAGADQGCVKVESYEGKYIERTGEMKDVSRRAAAL